MSCETYVEAMSALLDGTPSEPLEAHLAECPACRADFESMRAAHEALRTYPSAPWKPEMTEAILRRARPEPAPLWRWVGVAAGLAAAIAVAFLLRSGAPAPDEELSRHVAAVGCLAGQPGDPAADPSILTCQARLLRLNDMTERLSAHRTAPEVKAYLEETTRALNDVCTGTPEAARRRIDRLWGDAETLRAAAGWSPVPARIFAYDDASPEALYAEGRLHLGNGDDSAGIARLTRLVDHHPNSPYAGQACLLLGHTYLKNGSPLDALSFYASIADPAVITEKAVMTIKSTAAGAGRVFVQGIPIESLDAAALKEVARKPVPYELVRPVGDRKWETELLGPVPVKDLKPSSCRVLNTRRAVIDSTQVPDAELRRWGLQETMRARRAVRR